MKLQKSCQIASIQDLEMINDYIPTKDVTLYKKALEELKIEVDWEPVLKEGLPHYLPFFAELRYWLKARGYDPSNYGVEEMCIDLVTEAMRKKYPHIHRGIRLEYEVKREFHYKLYKMVMKETGEDELFSFRKSYWFKGVGIVAIMSAEERDRYLEYMPIFKLYGYDFEIEELELEREVQGKAYFLPIENLMGLNAKLTATEKWMKDWSLTITGNEEDYLTAAIERHLPEYQPLLRHTSEGLGAHGTVYGVPDSIIEGGPTSEFRESLPSWIHEVSGESDDLDYYFVPANSLARAILAKGIEVEPREIIYPIILQEKEATRNIEPKGLLKKMKETE